MSNIYPGRLRLWTIQVAEVWERLKLDGMLFVDPSYIDPSYLPAYDWMRDQMSCRIPRYSGRYPWWASYSSKPDLRRWSRYFPTGSKYVRLELLLAEEEVLLSSESAWVAVLNGWYLAINRADDRQWEEQVERAGLDPLDRSLPEPWQALRRASWERVFDLTLLEVGGEWSDVVQGTFECLRLDSVVDVTEFFGR